jgi:hypothetical protein
MTIGELIRATFPEGLAYDDAVQLCLTLYSFKVLPDEMMRQCTKENLAVVFADLASTGFVISIQPSTAVLYGANFHDTNEKGHWIEVIASIFKVGNTLNMDRSKVLAEKLSNHLVNVVP